MAEPTLELPTFRLLSLADGIFAMAITLLAFDLKVPAGATSDGDLLARMLPLWPKFASCGLSFLTLGYAWIGHHNQYVAIRRADRMFLWINVAFLGSIALVPFSTSMLAGYPLHRLAVSVYAGNLAIAGALLYAHWSYATAGHRLVDPKISPALVAATKRRVLIAPVSYLAAIALSFLSVKVSLFLCLMVPLYFMMPGDVDRHWKP